ncbi:MAG: 4'-phosphopantetheinyl transferase superfamily protein [Caldilineales bacterium]|nr:4'-phosphopantetheinyl transferase superfamily protein [Caldilineales bacterium]MDW8319050.1 4'-phosphopantetheinyl transferase superfamily protein [Anaerolineae bacterium]
MSTDWLAPPPDVTIGADEVHVWRAVLQARPSEVSRLWWLLSEDEHERARRFRFERDRRRFVVGRGLLRVLVGRYTASPPEAIRFSYSAHGKPAVAEPPTSLTFNLAHSEEWALFAFAWGRRVGVDIEHMRSDLADEQIARRFFAPGEVQALLGLPADQRSAAFFRCWTRKEAFVKARGEGLSLPLDAFEVSLDPDAATLLRAAEPDEVRRWQLAPLFPHPAYAAALAVEGDGWQLRCWHLAGPETLR